MKSHRDGPPAYWRQNGAWHTSQGQIAHRCFLLPDHRFAPLMLLVDRAALLVFAGLPALSLHRNQLTGEILAELSHLPEGPVEEFALDFAHFANGASIHLRPGVGE